VLDHSSEFEWGYGGSGPAQLALALLLDYFNDEQKAMAYHQEFKREVVSQFNDMSEWRLSGREIEEFVENHRHIPDGTDLPEESGKVGSF
jgi:hypothetical protein